MGRDTDVEQTLPCNPQAWEAYWCTQRLARLIGKGRALDLICTGRHIGAAEAKEMGLVNEVIPHDELMDRVRELAETLASKAPVAMRYCLEAVNQGAFHYLIKHAKNDEIKMVVRNALDMKRVRQENRTLRKQLRKTCVPSGGSVAPLSRSARLTRNSDTA